MDPNLKIRTSDLKPGGQRCQLADTKYQVGSEGCKFALFCRIF